MKTANWIYDNDYGDKYKLVDAFDPDIDEEAEGRLADRIQNINDKIEKCIKETRIITPMEASVMTENEFGILDHHIEEINNLLHDEYSDSKHSVKYFFKSSEMPSRVRSVIFAKLRNAGWSASSSASNSYYGNDSKTWINITARRITNMAKVKT